MQAAADARNCAILAGVNDELSDNAQLADIVRGASRDWPLTLLPGIGHIGLTVEPAAIAAVVATLA